MDVPERVVEFNDRGESLTHLLRIACGLESMIGSAVVDLAEMNLARCRERRLQSSVLTR